MGDGDEHEGSTTQRWLLGLLHQQQCVKRGFCLKPGKRPKRSKRAPGKPRKTKSPSARASCLNGRL